MNRAEDQQPQGASFEEASSRFVIHGVSLYHKNGKQLRTPLTVIEIRHSTFSSVLAVL
jgi:hypothetical protein